MKSSYILPWPVHVYMHPNTEVYTLHITYHTYTNAHTHKEIKFKRFSKYKFDEEKLNLPQVDCVYYPG